MSRIETLDPVFSKLDAALRSIGYSFESAVADIIDNSIDAQASSVLVRIIIQEEGKLALIIADDGNGMNESRLREAMRFGADLDEKVLRLGKFGLGLKLASLSQAKAVHVISNNGTDGICGRAWMEGGISNGFKSTVFEPEECRELLKAFLPERSPAKRGTVVFWQSLYRIHLIHDDPEGSAQKLLHGLQNHLAIVFHRFLEGVSSSKKQLNLELDVFDAGEETAGLPLGIVSLNPFGYPRSGQPGFPERLCLSGEMAQKANIRLHIWPPKSSLANYKLPGGSNSRQGFYFYRNDRLIQGGGWNGMRETEPHFSLARVEIDLDPSLDVEVSLDVKKSQAQFPRQLREAINSGKTASGITFKQYLGLAEKTYRERKSEHKDLPLVPGDGIPLELQEFLYKELRIKETSRCRRVKFEWAPFPKDEEGFFWPDPDKDTIYLNQEFRNVLLHGLKGSSADIPVFKCLLFFLIGDSLKMERWSPQMKGRLNLIDRALTKAAKLEMKNR